MPRSEPTYSVAMAACLVPRFHSTPSTNTVVTAGANVIGILLMASKIVPNWSPWVDHSMASTMMTPVVIRPMVTTRASAISGPPRLTTSIEISVAQLFSAAAMQLINAAAMLAASRPLSPTGIRIVDQRGQHGVVVGLAAARDVEQVEGALLPQYVTDHARQHHEEHRRDLEKAGEQRRRSAPPSGSFAPSTRCTCVWSAHQYQIPRIGYPSKTASQEYSFRCPWRSTIGCSMLNWPGLLNAAWKPARSWTPTAGSAR